MDGVILVCEHGNYPHNEKQQQLYPRYEFFEQVVKVFKDSGRSCPVFVDKHLSYDWRKAKQMYDWSRELKFPFMAGSSVPVTFRRPEYDPALGVEMETALSVGGGWVADGGIFHILDTLQAFVERRKGGETGVRAVQMLKGDEVWKAAQQGLWRRDLLDAALARREKVRSGKRPEDMRAVLGLIEYRDGFRGAVLALDEVSEYLVAVKPKGKTAGSYALLHTDREFEQFLDAGPRHHADDRNRKRAVPSRAHITGHRRVGSLDGFGLPERQEVGDTGTDGRVQGPCPIVGMRTEWVRKEHGRVLEAKSEKFWQVIDKNAQVKQVCTGFGFTEGPVFSRRGYLLFSDIPNTKIMKWERGQLTTLRENSNKANGLTLIIKAGFSPRKEAAGSPGQKRTELLQSSPKRACKRRMTWCMP